ncbi:MAG: hypothetical protein BWZ07_00523 [Alphaproteobacteria bacterium ADurb.BinA280]|jgi:hypothetical protein|nr:MAG: hypothetical protein BWZ07_00523 [Alphaproteobacteria bacterium ADurb.BinA280]
MASRSVWKMCVLLLGCGIGWHGYAAEARDPATPAAFDRLIGDAKATGDGPLRAYAGKQQTLLSLPTALEGRLLFWYVEAARFPESAVATLGNEVAGAVVVLEQHGDRLMVRDRSPAFQKRSGSGVPRAESIDIDERRSSAAIDTAIDGVALGPIIAVFPILAEAEGRWLIDLTATFSNDIDGLTATNHILQSGLVPAPIGLTVDPTRSFISDIDAYPTNLHIRTQLTFRGADPAAPAAGFKPITIELGHSLVLLPEKPMAARRYDDRVGFIPTQFAEFETADGKAVSNDILHGVIRRHRLEKRDPVAAVSEPIKPIVFYVGPGVPDRWRPYIKAGVEMWQPAFEKAGYRNAILAMDAPTPEQDPEWSPEDARYNVIRWLPQPFVNAMGPSVSDPRSGEILFAHVMIWPQVLDYFSNYYWLMAYGIEPDVKGLPLSEAKQGQLLQYIVAHEVGHSIGLRHNHLASTAYSVADLRNPSFANVRGSNASIMAYGRMNQAAQPGDGVTRVLPIIGPYDEFAIQWGYGTHGDTPEAEQAELTRLAAASVNDPLLRWGAGEDGVEDRWAFDPRVLRENVGAERIEATRLGLRKIGLAVDALPTEAPQLVDFRATYDLAIGQFDTFLSSVLKLMGGQLTGAAGDGRPQFVPATEQRAAVAFLLDEGPRMADVFLKPEIVARGEPFAGDRLVDTRRARYVRELLSGPLLARVQTQHQIDPTQFGVSDLITEVTAHVWRDLDDLPNWRRLQQSGWLDMVEAAVHPTPDPMAAAKAAELLAQRYSQGYVVNQLARNADSMLPGYALETLPGLATRLRQAARKPRDEESRVHLLAMARRMDLILKPATP